MKIIKKIYLLLPFCVAIGVINNRSFAQIDDLHQMFLVLNRFEKKGDDKKGNGVNDTGYVKCLLKIASLYAHKNQDSCMYYADKANDASQTIHFPLGNCEAHRIIAKNYERSHNYEMMLGHYRKALEIAQKMQGYIPAANIFSDIGEYFTYQNEFDSSLVYYQKSLVQHTKANNELGELQSLIGMAEAYYQKSIYDSAIDLNEEAMEIAIKLKDDSKVASIENDLGKSLYMGANYAAAIKMHREALRYFSSKNDLLGKTHSLELIAQCQLHQNKPDSAIFNAKESYSLAKAIRARYEAAYALNILSGGYESIGDYKEALKDFKLYKSYSDSLLGEQTLERTDEIVDKFKIEKRNQEHATEEAIRDAKLHQQIQNQQLQLILAGIMTIIMVAIIIMLYLNRKEKIRIYQLLHQKNLEIEKKSEMLGLSLKQKDKLFSIIAHDLRGPLQSLKGFLDYTLVAKLPPEEVEMFLSELSKDVNKTSELVTNLLSWSSSQLEGYTVNPKDTDLTTIANNMVALYSKQAQEKGITLTSLFPLSNIVFADPDMIQLVFRNLISNSIKFCVKNCTITLSLKDMGDKVEICVADTGVGMKLEVKQKIERHESITTFGTKREKGTGIGLLLCKEFVEKNKGEFTIDSKEGEGTRIYFTLPKPTV